jgi:REP element-mobilizing transposase RayT
MHVLQYRRNLPHLQPESTPLFITWRLWGSLPAIKQQKVLISDPTPGRIFAAKDRLLDKASGPKWLGDTRIAGFVATQIRRGNVDRGFYSLHAWVIMPNHVHLLFTPNLPVRKIMRWLKGSTANCANKVLRLTGSRFWQDESWDRSVRSGDELRRIVRYIEFNPVAARLVESPEDWPWSSASVMQDAQAEAPVPHS